MIENTNSIDTVRGLMIDQLRALRSASPEQLQQELHRAKGVAELSQTLINSAKVEVEFLQVTNQEGSAFLGKPASDGSSTVTGNGPGNGITSITRHRLGK